MLTRAVWPYPTEFDFNHTLNCEATGKVKYWDPSFRQPDESDLAVGPNDKFLEWAWPGLSVVQRQNPISGETNAPKRSRARVNKTCAAGRVQRGLADTSTYSERQNTHPALAPLGQ
jgi:hypothetical protein